jgi:hypothetical protein
MPMFIQTFNVDSKNNYLHFDNINTANLLAHLFNQNIMAEPSSFVYNGNLKRVELHKEFDLHPEYSKIIALMINWILLFEEKFDDKDLYLIPFLHNIRDFIIFNSDVDKNVKTYILKDLNMTDYFGKTSATFLKDKLNEFLVD